MLVFHETVRSLLVKVKSDTHLSTFSLDASRFAMDAKACSAIVHDSGFGGLISVSDNNFM